MRLLVKIFYGIELAIARTWASFVVCHSVMIATCFCGFYSLPLTAQESIPDKDLFENHVRPLLVSQCIKCHGDTKQEGGLRLTTIDELLRGGESGPAIVAGKPDESLLIQALRYESFEMPPSGQLNQKVVDGIANWIKAGGVWPQGVVLKPTPKISGKDRAWWCYQPISTPPIPKVEDNGWCLNEIDRFIFERLKREGVVPTQAAESPRLARRVHFAVTGLPPDESIRKLMESGPGWYENLVDKLLASTSYGENQARFWLDLVRYADSDGYNADHSRPEAYLYRDYVIRSFNDDKPYNRFVMEQLAGDEVDPGNRDALIGTMYLRHWIYEHNQRDVEGQWAQILSDVTETTADVFLAQGLKCARCHDHKFDPLLQRDYYAMRAFFTPLIPREDQPIADVATRKKYLEQQRNWENATEDIRKRLHEIETPELLAHATREGVHRFTKEIQAMVGSRRHELSPYEKQIATMASKQFDVLPEKLPEWLEKDEEAERQKLLAKLAKFDHLKPKPLPTLKFVASDVGAKAPPTFIPDIEDKTPIEPGFPKVLNTGPAKVTPAADALQSTGRRTALARWIVSKNNPLTARVIVNRIWQQHFGRGLVETTSDFGHLGTRPSHPELLDWLAQRFIADGWSFKKLHRLILTSATYRQSTRRKMDLHLASLDPQNELLWRMNPRRLSAEEIHDCVVTACGEMGPKKRAIYKPVKRNSLDPLLAAFDFPDRVESQCKRHRTTTSPQSLLMMNNPWLHERAKALAKNVTSSPIESLIDTAYRRLYFRNADPDEIDRAARFVERYASRVPEENQPGHLKPMPDGRPAMVFKPDHAMSIKIAPIEELQDTKHDGDFTIEATVLLNSLYPDAKVRTIVNSWTNKNSERGWCLGVTSTKSAFQPRNLILQFVGSRNGEKGKPEYEVIPSGLRVDLNKPYYIAVSIDLDDTSSKGVTFYLKDLSRRDSKPQVASVPHKARWNIQAQQPIEIGGRSGHHRWDGLIQNVRLHHGKLSREALLSDVRNGSRKVFDIQFSSEEKLGHDVSGNRHHALISESRIANSSPAVRARIALLHALICSNEVIYVD